MGFDRKTINEMKLCIVCMGLIALISMILGVQKKDDSIVLLLFGMLLVMFRVPLSKVLNAQPSFWRFGKENEQLQTFIAWVGVVFIVLGFIIVV